jgi:raffinose/stachyose/melibiose transport system permease protein
VKTKSIERFGMIIFLLPAVLLFIGFFAYPIGFVLTTSFMKWDGMSKAVFDGFQNYKNIFSDDVFISSIKNNIIWALAGGFIQVPLAVLVALLLSKKPKGWKALRTVYFFPNIISGLALAMMWLAIFNNDYGVLNALLRLIGLGNLQHNWLGDMGTAFPSMVIYWLFYVGYFMVIILAEVTSIPESYYEAAKIDGASTIKQDLYITLPLIKGSVATCTTLAMVYGIRQFEQVYLMTNGGPDNKTSVMVLYLFKGLQNFDYGAANATGVVLILIGSLVILAVNKLYGVGKDEV